jgi:uncharacterized protein YecE (DUF72 family)
MPKREVVESWAAQTPDGFRFAIKVSQRITHRKRLKEVEEEVDYLLGQLEPLGDRLGVLLVQLPPNAKQNLERLERFLDHLGRRARAAFEFRHESWQDDTVLACLRERGAAWVASETTEAEATLHETAGFGYLRLRREDYAPPDLVAWADRLRATAWGETFVFFKHEVVGPALACEFNALAGPRRAVSVPAKATSAREREPAKATSAREREAG